MTFDIRFISRTSGRRPITSGESVGQITLGDFKERFRSELSYWLPSQYEQQWRQAIERIVNGGDSSALITSLAYPKSSAGLIWWPLYRVGSAVYVRNEMPFLDESARSFDIADPYAFIRERSYATEGEYPVSEWAITLDDITDFLRRSEEG